MNLLVDRKSIQTYIYGRTGKPTANTVNGPERFVSKNTSFAFDPAKANALLDEAGWKKGSDGIRAKDGKKLKLLFQTSINAPRQKTQAIIKQAAAKAGIEIELKSVTGSVFFSSDPANPDTCTHFYADMEMYAYSMTQADPAIWLLMYASWEVAQKANKCRAATSCAGATPPTTRLQRRPERARPGQARGAADHLQRPRGLRERAAADPPREVSAVGATLTAPRSGWDNDLSFLPDWYREA